MALPPQGELTAGHSPGAARSDNEAKYRSRNPVVRHLVRRFVQRIGDLVETHGPGRILEVGCGEGVLIELVQAPPEVVAAFNKLAAQ